MNESMPRPGEHPAVPHASVTPEDVVIRIDKLLEELDTAVVLADGDADAFAAHTRIFEAAHDVLMGSLSAVDRS